MSKALAATLAQAFPDSTPPWIDPLVKAVQRLEVLEQRAKDAREAEEYETLDLKALQQRMMEELWRRVEAPSDSASSTGREGEGTEDDGWKEGDDEEIMQSAKDLLKSAIELSEESVALPYTWLSVLHTRNEERKEARECALQAAMLDPLNTANLLRLASAEEQDRAFISAYSTFEKAVSLLPLSEQAGHAANLARLRDLKNDNKANITRRDPFDIFPLEIIIRILQLYQNDNPDAALICSWVSRRWRTTINNSCPELFKTWTFTHQLLKKTGSVWDERQSAWTKRAQGKVDTLALLDQTKGAVNKLEKHIGLYICNVKALEVGVRNSAVLKRLAESLLIYGTKIETLRITHGGRLGSSKDVWSPGPRTITCSMNVNINKLHTVELNMVDFQDPVLYARMSREARRVPRQIREPIVGSYPALKRLSAVDCAFDNVYAVSSSGSERADLVKYQADVLHSTLRGTPNLEYLLIRPYGLEIVRTENGYDDKITLPCLKTAIIPPPAIWCLDILAPNLQNLAFRFPGLFTGTEYRDIAGGVPPMMPLPDESLVRRDALAKLESLELACYSKDDVSRLEAWVSRAESLTRLVIVAKSTSPYPTVVQNGSGYDNRASTRIMELLNNNPTWCPKMQTLELHDCFTPGKILVEYVRKRKSHDCANINTLTLKSCSALSAKAKRVLEKQVGNFECRDEYDPLVPELIELRNRYMDDGFPGDEE